MSRSNKNQAGPWELFILRPGQPLESKVLPFGYAASSQAAQNARQKNPDPAIRIWIAKPF